MINYILISTLIVQGSPAQSTAMFYDKTACEYAALQQENIYKSMNFHGYWNLTCHPYQILEIKK